MKKIAILILSILIAGLFVACNQDITVDAQTYANMEVGTFVLNGQNYATLQEAVNAKLGKSAKAVGDNDGVIYLTRNASGPGAVIDVSGTPVIIDFAGYTYSFTNVTGLQGGDNPQADTFGLGITNGADVTLKGLEQINLNDTTTSKLTMVYVAGSNTKLTIEDAPKMKVEPEQYVFWAADGATLTIGSTSETAATPTTITGKIAATGGTEQTSKPVVTFNNNTKIEASELKADSAVVVINTSEASTIGSFVGANEANIVVSGTGNVTVNKNDSSDGTYEIENTSSSSETKVEVPTKDGSTTREITPGEKVEGDAAPEEDTTPSVARIGSVLFDSLRLAISTASRGDTVVLLKDISVQTEDSTIHESSIGKACFPVDTQIDIDGGGHVITASGDGRGYVFYFMNTSVEDGVTYTMKDLKIESTLIQAIVMTNQWDDPFDNDLVQLTNIEITCDGECAYINGFTHFSAENCKFSQNGEYASGKDAVYYSAVIVGYGGTATLNDCTVESFKNGVATFPSGGTINLYNTSLTVTSESTFAFWSRIGNGSTTSSEYSDSIINVFSGNYSGKFKLTDKSAIHDAYILVTGGTFDVDPSDYVAEGYEAVKQGTDPETWKVVEKEPVAIIGEAKYYSLQSALDAVKEGETILLLKNVSYDHPVYFSNNLSATLNLNEKTLQVTGGKKGSYDGGRAIKIKAGTLTINNGTIDGRNYSSSGDPTPNPSTSADWSDTRVGGCVRVDGGNAILEGLTMYNNDGWGTGIKVDSGTLSMSKCTINSIYGACIEVAGGNATLKDSKLSANDVASPDYHTTCVAVSYGGDVSATNLDCAGEYSYYAYNTGGSILVSGGSASGKIALDTSADSVSNSVISIVSGEYSNVSFALSDYSEQYDTVLSISGGTFDHDPSDYVADGYVAKAQGTTPETWVVVPDTPQVSVIKNGESEGVTMSLASFRNKVNAGNTYEGYTVTLLVDVDLKGSETNQWVPIGTEASPFKGTFDGNKKTVSNLYMNNTTDGEDYALFGVIENALVKDLTVSGEVSAYKGAAGLAAKALGNTTIKNVISNVNASAYNKAGGIVCSVYPSYSYKTSPREISEDRVVQISGCKNSGTITCLGQVSANTHMIAGGIAGYVGQFGRLVCEDCVNEGTIKSLYNNPKSVTGMGSNISSFVVGFCANNVNVDDTTSATKNGCYITNCVNNGTDNLITIGQEQTEETATIRNNVVVGYAAGCGTGAKIYKVYYRLSLTDSYTVTESASEVVTPDTAV